AAVVVAKKSDSTGSRFEHSTLISGTRMVVPAASVQERLAGEPSGAGFPFRKTTLPIPRSQRADGSWIETYVCHHCAVRGPLGSLTAGSAAAGPAMSRTTRTAGAAIRQRAERFMVPPVERRATPNSGDWPHAPTLCRPAREHGVIRRF